jgi:hypothetical protein
MAAAGADPRPTRFRHLSCAHAEGGFPPVSGRNPAATLSKIDERVLNPLNFMENIVHDQATCTP